MGEDSRPGGQSGSETTRPPPRGGECRIRFTPPRVTTSAREQLKKKSQNEKHDKCNERSTTAQVKSDEVKRGVK